MTDETSERSNRMYDIEVFENQHGDISIKQSGDLESCEDAIIVISKEQSELICKWIESIANGGV